MTELTQSDWYKISLALQNHIITHEQQLIAINAGDREWQYVRDYENILTKINFIIAENYDV